MPKNVSASVAGSNFGTGKYKDPKLVVETNEVKICIEDTPVTALLDTGSCVSVISESFLREFLSNTSIKPINDILNIECADGNRLPYLGYVEVKLHVVEGLPKSNSHQCLLLVTPDTKYSSKTPVILGTNILQELLKECKENFGNQFLQKADLFTPWYLSFRAILIREKGLQRNKNRLAIVRSAALQKIILKPNETLEVKGYTDKEIDYPSTSAILQETPLSTISSNIDINPAVVQYCYRKNGEMKINMSNLTTHTLTIPPRAVICELQ